MWQSSFALQLKKVHIEIVNILTKDDCLDAVERFCGRSGLLKAFHRSVDKSKPSSTSLDNFGSVEKKNK